MNHDTPRPAPGQSKLHRERPEHPDTVRMVIDNLQGELDLLTLVRDAADTVIAGNVTKEYWWVNANNKSEEAQIRDIYRVGLNLFLGGTFQSMGSSYDNGAGTGNQVGSDSRAQTLTIALVNAAKTVIDSFTVTITTTHTWDTTVVPADSSSSMSLTFNDAWEYAGAASSKSFNGISIETYSVHEVIIPFATVDFGLANQAPKIAEHGQQHFGVVPP